MHLTLGEAFMSNSITARICRIALIVSVCFAPNQPVGVAARSVVVDKPQYDAPILQQSATSHATGVVLIGVKESVRLDTVSEGRSLLNRAPMLEAAVAALGVKAIEPVFPLALAREQEKLGGTKTSPLSQILRLRLAEDADLEGALSSLKKNPDVAFAELDYQTAPATVSRETSPSGSGNRPALTPNDPLLSGQWGLT